MIMMDASTIASRLVGTWMTGTPRRYVAATKPARSPTTPPPNATTTVSRPAPSDRSQSVSVAHCSRVFEASPAGTVVLMTVAPGIAELIAAVAGVSQCRATWSSEMIA